MLINVQQHMLQEYKFVYHSWLLPNIYTSIGLKGEKCKFKVWLRYIVILKMGKIWVTKRIITPGK